MSSTDTYSELYYHFVWATKNREPYITEDAEATLYRYIQWKCTQQSVLLHAIGGMPDHVHLICSIPPKLSISVFMQELKGASAHYFNCEYAKKNMVLGWQPGYGVLTVSKSHLSTVAAYVANQKVHHTKNTVKPKLERTYEA